MCPDIYLSPLSPHHSFTLSLCIVSGCWLPFIVSSAITQRSSTPAKAVKPALKCSSFRPYMTRVNRFLVVFVFSAIFFVCQLYWNSTGLWRKCPFTGRGMLIKNGSTLISNWQVHALGICFVDFVKHKSHYVDLSNAQTLAFLLLCKCWRWRWRKMGFVRVQPPSAGPASSGWAHTWKYCRFRIKFWIHGIINE